MYGSSLFHVIIYLIAGIQLTPMNGVTRTYANNSIVSRMDIGTGSAALLCTTTYSPCCVSVIPPVTHWYFPDGSRVVNDASLPYYRTRSGLANPGSVMLHRNPQGTTTGLFHCDIPDGSGVLQSLFVGIYGESCTLIDRGVDYICKEKSS